jgi:hypothetical protein
MREARVVADHLFRKDIYRVQHWRKVWGKVDPPPLFGRYRDLYADYLRDARLHNSYYPYYILDTEPEYMSLQNQEEEAAGTIHKLGALEFLCRPAVGDGAVSDKVIAFSVGPAISDPVSGQQQFPDPDQDAALISQVQQQLAARSGIPMEEILQEQETRLTKGTLQPHASHNRQRK